MFFKRFLLAIMISSVTATLAIAAECPGSFIVGESTCTLREAGSNGDGRVYCYYTCKDSVEVVIIFTPQGELQVY